MPGVLRFATLRRRPHRSYLAQESEGSWVRLYRGKQVRKTRFINAGGVQQVHVKPHSFIVSQRPAFVNNYDIGRVGKVGRT